MANIKYGDQSGEIASAEGKGELVTLQPKPGRSSADRTPNPAAFQKVL